MIDEKLLKHYQMQTLEEFKMIFGEGVEVEKSFYRTFLQQTDHIPLKIFESFIEDMATASALEMPAVIIKFFADVKVNFAEELTARKFARAEMNKLEENV